MPKRHKMKSKTAKTASPMPFGWGGFDAKSVAPSTPHGRKLVSNAFRLGGL